METKSNKGNYEKRGVKERKSNKEKLKKCKSCKNTSKLRLMKQKTKKNLNSSQSQGVEVHKMQRKNTTKAQLLQNKQGSLKKLMDSFRKIQKANSNCSQMNESKLCLIKKKVERMYGKIRERLSQLQDKKLHQQDKNYLDQR